MAHSNRRLDLALLLLRVSIGGAMAATHGFPKLMRIIEGNPRFGDPLGIGSVPSLYLVVGAEFICAILVVLGLFTRWAVIPLIFTMGVAFFVAHGGDPWGDREGSFLYLMPFIALLLTGAGAYSLDARLRPKAW